MTKHLDSLKIQNFRMLEDFEVAKLGQVNLIVGKNNSGKSTVLEALRIYAGNANRRLLEEIAKSHDEIYSLKDEDIQAYTPSSIRPFFSFFSKNHNNRIFYIGCSNGTNSLKFSHQNFSDMTHPLELKAFSDFKYYEYYKIVQGAYECIEPLQINKISLTNNMPAPTHESAFIATQLEDTKNLANKWDSIVFTNFEIIVIEFLRMIEPTIQGVAFIQDKNKVSGERTAVLRLQDQNQPIPLKSLGEGMQRILQIALSIYKAKDGFLLIDEFENGLHYSVQEKVWNLIFEMAKRLNIQVFATTHSWDCIEAFSKVAKEREDVEGLLFRMGRSAKTSDKGKVIATIFDEDKLQRFTQADMEVR